MKISNGRCIIMFVFLLREVTLPIIIIFKWIRSQKLHYESYQQSYPDITSSSYKDEQDLEIKTKANMRIISKRSKSADRKLSMGGSTKDSHSKK